MPKYWAGADDANAQGLDTLVEAVIKLKIWAVELNRPRRVDGYRLSQKKPMAGTLIVSLSRYRGSRLQVVAWCATALSRDPASVDFFEKIQASPDGKHRTCSCRVL